MARCTHWILSGLIAFAGLSAAADVVQLTDGTRLEGSVRRSEDGRWMVFVKGRPVFVAMSDVQSITLTPMATSTTREVDDRLNSLRRSVAQLDDLNQIIARYQLFVQQVKEPSVLEPARRELADYQALSNANAVRVGNQWMTPAQRTARVAASPPPIEAARAALKQDRFDQARAALVDAAKLTPDDPAIAYLSGFMEARQNNLAAARVALDALLVLVPNHAPTLNNLAVVQWRQRQFLAALSSYDAALTAAPQSVVVLHNLSVALADMPELFQSTPIYQQVSDHFQQQDHAMVVSMAQQGFTRFGDQWLPAAQVEQLQLHHQEMHQQLDGISDSFDIIRQKIEQLDQRRANLEADRLRVMGPGPTPFDLSYSGEGALSSPLSSDLAEDEQQDRLQRRLLVGKLDALTAQAKQLQAQLAVPSAGHQQRLIGVEGTPFIPATVPAAVPRAATTRPAAA